MSVPMISVPLTGPGSSLVAYYTFDDCTAIDSSGSGKNGTVIGADCVTGKIGPHALGFDGTNDYVLASLATPKTDGVTLAAWVFWTGGNTSMSNPLIVYNGKDGADGFGIHISNGSCGYGNKLVAHFASVSCQAVTSTYTVPPNTWTHVALTHDASTWTLFANGVPVGTGSGSPPPKVPTTRTAIGGSVGADRLAGRVDDVRIYERALSANEVQQLFCCTPDPNPPTTPTDLLGTAVSSTKVNLSWNASTDDTGVAGYWVYRNGVAVGESTCTSCSDNGVMANTTYSYTVAAVDSSGNMSSQSAPRAMTTPASPTLCPLSLTPGSCYLTDPGGNPIFLTSSHHWGNLQDFSKVPCTTNYTEYLNMCVQKQWNSIRLWTMDKPSVMYGSSQDWGLISPLPWSTSDECCTLDGRYKWDLSVLNQEYFDRMSNRVAAANACGIYVSVMLFNGVAIRGHPEQWATNCYNPANNVNHLTVTPTTIYTSTDQIWLECVTKYVRKVVDTVNGFDGVMYEIGNEMPSFSKNFQYDMVKLIKDYEATPPRAKQHLVGMTSFDCQTVRDENLPGNTWLIEGPGDWISLFDGDIASPPFASGRVNLYDSDHVQACQAEVEWAWKVFTRGHGGVWNMDPSCFPGQPTPDDGIRTALGAVRKVAGRVHLKTMVPSASVCTSCFCLSNSLGEYVLYLPDHSQYTVNLPLGWYRSELIDSTNGTLHSVSRIHRTTNGAFSVQSDVAGAEVYLILPATVEGRFIFYNNCHWDSTNSDANAGDDHAIAIDKVALRRGGKASFANYTSYNRGINGIMIDLSAASGTLSLSDFGFKLGNDNCPDAWPDAPLPSTVAIRPGAGVNGSDRITLIWPDNAIPSHHWLEVRVRANANTGLASDDIFYFGNAIGETGDVRGKADVLVNDAIRILNNMYLNVPITNVFDIDRDGDALVNDACICLANLIAGARALQWIDLSALAPSNLSQVGRTSSATENCEASLPHGSLPSAAVGNSAGAGPAIVAELNANGDFVLCVPETLGHVYRLECCDGLGTGAWRPLDLQVVRSPGNYQRWVVPIEVRAPQRFYRVLMSPETTIDNQTN
jgi:hypothetical protein